MATINISIPSQLKSQVEELVDLGFYSSFSDVIRDALRKLLEKDPYESQIREAMDDYHSGRGITVDTKEDLQNFFKNL